MPLPIRIPAARLSPLTPMIFGSAFTGAALAERVGASTNTFWVWFNRRGITVANARAVSNTLAEWASVLLQASVALRQLADEFDPEAA